MPRGNNFVLLFLFSTCPHIFMRPEHGNLHTITSNRRRFQPLWRRKIYHDRTRRIRMSMFFFAFTHETTNKFNVSILSKRISVESVFPLTFTIYLILCSACTVKEILFFHTETFDGESSRTKKKGTNGRWLKFAERILFRRSLSPSNDTNPARI